MESLQLGLYGQLETARPRRTIEPTPPHRPAHQQLQQARGVVKMLLEYFQSDFAREAVTPLARTLDMCRAFAAVDLRFPEPHYIERAIREGKIADSIARDPSTVNRRHLADLHSMPIKEVTRLGKKNNPPTRVDDPLPASPETSENSPTELETLELKEAA